MKTYKLFGFAGLFILFIALFSGLYLVLGNITEAAPQVEQRAMAMEAAPSADDMEADTDSPDPGLPWNTALIIILFSAASTFLSWTVVDKVLRDRNEVVLLSFDDDEGKRMVDALTNETSRKIVDALSGEEFTASQLAEKLDMSLQRVHYNLKKLEDVGVIRADSYKYSERGKEMDVYSLTKKYFVIGPKE